MDKFDIFDKKLSWEEALQYDSLIDSGTYDPHLILFASMMNNSEYLPSNEQSKNILQHIENEKTNIEEEPLENTENIENNKNMEKEKEKNKGKEYIKLPDARIKNHSNQYESIETQNHNETRNNGRNDK